jgi:hypothetical protein
MDAKDMVSAYEKKTKEIADLLLERICSVGDTYEKHQENLDRASFLEIQLELVKKIVQTERRISNLRKMRANQIEQIEEARERRKLLKLLGSTAAWILLEFDRPYIRSFSRGQDPGFISGKQGLQLETIVLKTAFQPKDTAAVLHDITSCLHTGDLSIIGPRGIMTLELKLVAGKGKPDRRERRQKKRGEIIREFYDKGISSRILSGWTSIRRISKTRDKHNWSETCEVIKEATETGHGACIVDNCLIYCAFRNNEAHALMEDLPQLHTFKDPLFVFGCHDRHIDPGIPEVMPFTCFEIPLSYKKALLSREVNLCILLDLNSLARIVQENGYVCRVLPADSNRGYLEVSEHGHEKESMTIGSGTIYRLLYECLSVETFIAYLALALAETPMSK